MLKRSRENRTSELKKDSDFDDDETLLKIACDEKHMVRAELRHRLKQAAMVALHAIDGTSWDALFTSALNNNNRNFN